MLRLLGSGSRFESITRGVLDLRDLWYYLSLTIAFLSLNVYSLERLRWSGSSSTPRHRYWRTATGLILLNLVAANVWLTRIDSLRLDLTQGRLYSISRTYTSFPRPITGAAAYSRLFQCQNAPAAGTAGATVARPGCRNTPSPARAGCRWSSSTLHNTPSWNSEANERFGIQRHAVPGCRPLPGNPGELLLSTFWCSTAASTRHWTSMT